MKISKNFVISMTIVTKVLFSSNKYDVNKTVSISVLTYNIRTILLWIVFELKTLRITIL